MPRSLSSDLTQAMPNSPAAFHHPPTIGDVQEHLFELYGNVQNARASEIQFIGHDLVKDRTVPTSQFFAEGEGTEWTEQGGNFISFRRVPNSASREETTGRPSS
ncbi:unnamed protein product [Vitrella brassicaformis CCMP3155]|uniref:Uncharacterized protein n=1 Tax=Vitrella brassicaformis (strain CCMP3155) TaxID=1169540 RepID=A0A0G4FLJ7_VITBC|nr:unnamed protein product [Vitrella brassicaformis CCMP3155]|eukprot:CEM14794.1 unnamed protein product [Vitrella brassicaformis CCMP3155]